MTSFLKFCVVGATGMAVDMSGLYLFSAPSLLSLPLPLAKALSTECGILNNFVWNDLWTFRGARQGGRADCRVARFLRFNAIALGGLVLNIGLFQAQVQWLGVNIYLANAVAIVLVAFFNYWMSRTFGWRMSRVA